MYLLIYPYVYIYIILFIVYIYIYIGTYFSHTCSSSSWDSWAAAEATKPTQALGEAIRNLGLLTRNFRISGHHFSSCWKFCATWWISNQILYILENPPTILGREISWLALPHRKFTQKSSKKARVRDWHFSVNPGWATPTIPYNLRNSSSFNHCPETPSPMISTASRGNQCHKEKSPKLILQRVKGGARCGDFFFAAFFPSGCGSKRLVWNPQTEVKVNVYRIFFMWFKNPHNWFLICGLSKGDASRNGFHRFLSYKALVLLVGCKISLNKVLFFVCLCMSYTWSAWSLIFFCFVRYYAVPVPVKQCNTGAEERSIAARIVWLETWLKHHWRRFFFGGCQR